MELLIPAISGLSNRNMEGNKTHNARKEFGANIFPEKNKAWAFYYNVVVFPVQ